MNKLSLYAFLVLMFYNVSFADSLRVVDGDTIVFNGEKIRLSGIDTPELIQTCISGDETDCREDCLAMGVAVEHQVMVADHDEDDRQSQVVVVSRAQFGQSGQAGDLLIRLFPCPYRSH